MAGRGIHSFYVGTFACRSIIRSLKAGPSGVYGDKPRQKPLPDDCKLRKEPFVFIARVPQKMLDCDKVIPGDDGLMVVFLQILVAVLPVFLGFMVQIVRRSGFAGEYIAAVALVLKLVKHR